MKYFSILFFSILTCAARQEGKDTEKYESVTPAGNYLLARHRIDPVTVRMGMLDKNGKVRIPFQYDGIKPVNDRAIVFVIKNKRYVMGVVDFSNRPVIPLNYFDLEAVHQCFTAKNDQHKAGVFSKDGSNLTGFDLDSVKVAGPCLLLYKEKRMGLMSGTGKILFPLEYSTIEVGEKIKLQKPSGWFRISAESQRDLGIEADEIVPSDNTFIIRVGNKWGVRDSARLILPVKYLNIQPCGKNFLVKTKSGWHFFDRQTQRLHDREYDSIQVRDSPLVHSDFWGMINENGVEILPCIYDSIGEKKGNNVPVKMRNRYGIISIFNKWIETPAKEVRWINNDLYISGDSTTTRVKDVTGRIIFTGKYKITAGDNYFREVTPEGKQTDYDFNGHLLRESSADNKWVCAFSEGLQGVCNDRRFGFINKNNLMMIGNRYENIKPFSEGLAAVKVHYWGFINQEDKFVVQPAFDSVGRFEKHLCIVSRDGKWGIVNDKGEEVLALGYDKVIRSHDSFLLINKNRTGLANARGEVAIDPRFDLLQPFPEGCLAGQNKKFGLITREGISITPIIYSKIIYNPFQKNFLAKKEGEWIEREHFK